MPTKLIVYPKPDDVKETVSMLQSLDVGAYIARCATVGIRPRILLKAVGHEIDFESGFVNINGRYGKKVYRLNPLHKGVAALLQELYKTSTGERAFEFAYKKVQTDLKAIDTKWRPNNMRDRFYNKGRKHCGYDQIELAMAIVCRVLERIASPTS